MTVMIEERDENNKLQSLYHHKVTSHIVEGDSANHQIEIVAIDAPGSGGANHYYSLGTKAVGTLAEFEFQNGPITSPESVNGVTNEALIAIVIDRLDAFQHGAFACEANDMAKLGLESAMSWLQKRTKDRIARGVEGKLEK